jgi:hypothetical protein
MVNQVRDNRIVEETRLADLSIERTSKETAMCSFVRQLQLRRTWKV